MRLLTVAGRRSGQPRSTPVVPVVTENGCWLVAPFGDVGWVRNARAAEQVTLRRGPRRGNLPCRRGRPRPCGTGAPRLPGNEAQREVRAGVLRRHPPVNARGSRRRGASTPRVSDHARPMTSPTVTQDGSTGRVAIQVEGLTKRLDHAPLSIGSTCQSRPVWSARSWARTVRERPRRCGCFSG